MDLPWPGKPDDLLASGTCLTGAPSVSCSTVLAQAGIDPLRLLCLPVVVDTEHKLMLHVVAVAQPRLLLQVDLVLLAGVLAAVWVLELEAFSTTPRKFYVPCDSPSTGGWHPTSLCLGS